MTYGSSPTQWPRPERSIRLSPAVYRRRRITVLAAGVFVVYGLQSVLSAVFSAEPATAATTTLADASPITATVPLPPTTLPGDAAAATTASSTSSTTSTTSPPEDPRQISLDDPARIYVAGDSDAGTFGPFLQDQLSGNGWATMTLDYKVSTGLSRPDYYDWGARFNEQVPTLDPDIVIVSFGGNDAQGLRNIDETWAVPYSPASGQDDNVWRAEYGRRVGSTMDYLLAGGRSLIWVGIPNHRDPDVSARMEVQNEVARDEAAKRPGVLFVDTWQRFLAPNGEYAEFRIDPRTKEGVDVRTNDGFHLNENGAEILALDVLDVLLPVLRERGAQL